MVIATHGFVKKTQKTPQKEINKAITIREIYFTELSEVKLEVIMEVKGEVKGTIPHEQTASKSYRPASIAGLTSCA